MGEWAIPLHRSKANKLHKRFCRLLIIMALVGGALIEIGDNSTLDECEEGGPLVSIGNLFFWTSLLSVAINGLILFVSIFNERNECWRSLSPDVFSHHRVACRSSNFWRSTFVPFSIRSCTKLQHRCGVLNSQVTIRQSRRYPLLREWILSSACENQPELSREERLRIQMRPMERTSISPTPWISAIFASKASARPSPSFILT